MPKRYWWVILTYIAMQLSGGIFRPVLLRLFPAHQLEALIFYSIFSFTIGLIIVLILMKPDMQMSQTRSKWFTSDVIGWTVLGVFLAYFAQGIATMIEMNIFGIRTGSENTQAIMQITRTVPLFAIVPAIIAPILEEVIFRKIIFASLYKRTNFFIAALISALIFGIIHGEPEHILIYASMGFVFAFLYVKTKKIIVPIIVHMTLNSISVIYQYSLTPEQIEQIEQQWNQIQMILIGG
ncbi:CPBP family intramembrane metalloprotease [Ornithinibacillus massiliensis]|uniref:CPBP family intramembrane metalloprotease n=1 Tax=Ornithinibacillus massiliensis TaxID=1944633 RepID=A0ABS5MG15_9BACI|nr:type II CAAX endopeptidase family protein [Ornithinibacillus massiliensis]MBS3681255.1 CPBP family intramembrane metalloprotease [Ornithinibacillus massiliensis]